jgi:isocitrate dehydrogenase (NAD+)
MAQKKHTIVLIPGDGIGPEVMDATKRIIEAAGLSVEWVELPAGVAALEQGHDNVMPQRTLAAIKAHKVALKGPVTTPVGKGFKSVNVQLRQALNLYAAVRPVKSVPAVKTRFDNVDIVVIRENTEGLYSGIENEVTDGVVTSLKVATEKACTRIARYAFRYATRQHRRKITVFHKANIMKLTDGMFLDVTRRVAKRFADVEYTEAIVDACCMQLVRDPARFDVLVMDNLYGDILSDLCAGLVGGLGVVPGANFGENCAVFEAVHGSAPDIAGKGVANPTALILSAAMMLHAMGERDAAARVESAVAWLYAETDVRTYDLGGSVGTMAFAETLAKRVS